MAKKIVRGITDVKTITNQDFDTNNVNDLLSDGQYNYIHRKKGKTEEYHNLTDNIKTISSDNTELLSVTNNNKTTNTATLHPKHDAQKEQVIESTRDTIAINHGANGTAEKTTVDTNPNRVLEHDNLVSDSEYITLNHETGHSRTHIQAVKLKEKLDNLQQNKQDTLTAGTGITIQGNTISASGGSAPVEGASVTLQEFGTRGTGLYVVKYSIFSGHDLMLQYTFECAPGTREFDITDPLKTELGTCMEGLVDMSSDSAVITSGAITITLTVTNDGLVLKLVNSNYAAEKVYQQETFTFYKYIRPTE